MKNYPVLKILLLLFLAAAAFVLSVFTGPVRIPAGEIIKTISSWSSPDSAWESIILEMRLPRAAAASAGGAALALCGLTLQTFFRNPLAGPYVLGIGSGAGIGAAAVIFSGVSLLPGRASVIGASIAGAFIITLFLIFLIKKYKSITVTLIAGLMIGYFFNSIISILIRFSDNTALRSYINWTFGTFRNLEWKDISLFFPVLLVSGLYMFYISKHLDLYLLGETYASSMGTDIKKLRYSIIIAASLITGTVTAVCGPVSFIGIASPHFTRGILGTSRHRLLIPGTLLTGALLALCADMISSLPGGGNILPLNSVTAIIGVPVVLNVLLKSRKHGDF